MKVSFVDNNGEYDFVISKTFFSYFDDIFKFCVVCVWYIKMCLFDCPR